MYRSQSWPARFRWLFSSWMQRRLWVPRMEGEWIKLKVPSASDAGSDPGSEKLGVRPQPMDLQRWLYLLWLMSKPLCEGASLDPGPWRLRRQQQLATETSGVFGGAQGPGTLM
jgi:hypothetical protein